MESQRDTVFGCGMAVIPLGSGATDRRLLQMQPINGKG
jgi:hypothetical protein